jgi:hypothetical protein
MEKVVISSVIVKYGLGGIMSRLIGYGNQGNLAFLFAIARQRPSDNWIGVNKIYDGR